MGSGLAGRWLHPTSWPSNLALTVAQILDADGQSTTALLEIMAGSDVGLTVADPNQEGQPIIWASQGFSRISGYEQPDIVGRNCRFLQGADTDGQTVQEIRDALAANVTFSGEILNYRKDGTVFWNYLVITPVFDEQSRLAYLVGLQKDITRQKDEQIRLAECEQQLQMLQDTLPIVLITFDHAGLLKKVSGHGLGLMGMSAAASKGASVFKVFHDSPAFLDYCLRALAGKQFTAYLDVRGRHWEARFGVLQDELGKVASVTVVAKDITERILAEESYRKSEARYRSIFENSFVGIYLSTPDGRYIDVNPRLAKMYGYATPSELITGVTDIGQQVYVDPQTRAAFKQRIADRGEVQDMEYQIRRQDGAVIWVSESARAMKDSHGLVLYYEGTISDITRRKDAEAAQLRLETQLRHSQKLEAVGTLAGGIAHDFNNLLSVITAYAELATEDAKDNPRMRGDLQEILQAGNRARDLVRQILAFSRQTTNERTPVCLTTIVKECSKMLRAAIPTSIQIECDFETKEDFVLADTTQMYQVLMNLGTNAGYAMREKGGTLFFRLSKHMGALPNANALGGSGYVKIEVTDTGEGIPAEIQDKIFEPFFTTKPVGEGSGLGLSVVHGIIQAHGGTISVESVPGAGTRFTMVLPTCQSHPLATKETTSFKRGNKEMVLLVDDEEPLLAVLQKHMQKLGYRCVTRADGKEALRTFLSMPNEFAAVITDLSMPGMTGLELMRAIRRTSKDLPVIMITGNSTVLDESASPDEVKWLLRKPFSREQMGEMLQRAMLSARAKASA